MERETLKGPLAGTSEGAEVTVYYASHAPRLIVATFFGETGRATNRYYLRDTATFVLEREELDYARPISVERRPRIVSRVKSVTYFCEGQPLNAVYAATAG